MSERTERLQNRVLAAALAVAQARSWDAVTRDTVADQAGVSVGSVSNAYGSMDALKTAAMEAAVAQSIVSVVAAGIAAGYPCAKNAPRPLKVRALALLAA